MQREPLDSRNQMVNQYKRMLRLKASDVEDAPISANMVTTLKYDGELNFAFFDGEEVTFANRYYRLRIDTPSAYFIADVLKAHGIKEAILAGELYAVADDGGKLTLGEVMHRIKKPSNQHEEDSIRFAVFDIVSVDNEDNALDYIDTISMITEMFPNETDLAHHAQWGAGPKSLPALWERVISEGLEGVVIRGPFGNIKVKMSIELDLVVIGLVASGISWDRGEAGALALAFMDSEGIFRYAGTVGGGLRPKRLPNDNEEGPFFRKWWYDMAQNDNLGYKNLSGKNCLMVPPTVVLTIKADDWVVNNRQAYELIKTGYEYVPDRISAVGQKPRIVRWRKDKGVNNDDLRLEQLPGLTEEGE